MKLDEIQPSQLYISSKKLNVVLRSFPSELNSIEPVPIKKLGDEIVYVDGHTRAYAAFTCGFSEIPVYWEYEEQDWKAYEICVAWCKAAKILTIKDLKNRVISHQNYARLWYERCAKMQRDLKRRREYASNQT